MPMSMKLLPVGYAKGSIVQQRIKELEIQNAELRAENAALKKTAGELQTALNNHHAMSQENYERMSKRFERIREIDARHRREKSQWYENDRLEHKEKI